MKSIFHAKNTLIILYLNFIFLFASPQARLPCIKESPFKSNWKYLGPINYDTLNFHQKFGAINAIAVNPHDSNEIYIGGYTSGLFHTKNRGITWNCLTDNFMFPICGVSDIHVNFDIAPHKIMLCTGTHNYWYDTPNFGILFSDNNGESWDIGSIEGISTFMSIEFKQILKAKKSNVLFARSMKNIYHSLDGGKSWKILFSGDSVQGLILNNEYEISTFTLNEDESSLYFTTFTAAVKDESSKKILRECDFFKLDLTKFNSSSNRLIKLTDTLKNTYHNDLNNPTYALKISKGNEGHIFINRTYTKSFEHTIYQYQMDIEKVVKYVSPNNKTLIEDIYWRKGLVINTLNPAIQYLCVNMLYKSIDSGKTFNPMYGYSVGENNIPHADIRSAHFAKFSLDGMSDQVYLGTDGGLSFSGDGGRNFKNLSGNNLPISQMYGIGSSPFSGIISVGTQDNSIMTYNPSSKQWIYNVMGDGYDVEYSKRIPGEAFGQYNSRTMMRTINDSVPFNHAGFITSKEMASNKKTIATHKNGNTYFAEQQLNILKPNARKWETYNLPQPHRSLAIAISESNPSIIYMSNLWSDLLKSTDSGKTFTNISKQLVVNGQHYNSRIHAICISPTDPNKIWISLGYMGDYLDPCKATVRVLFSMNGGKDWINFSEGLPVYYVSDMVYLDGSNDALFASTFEGIYFKPSLYEPWGSYSTAMPKAIYTELHINYCRGKLLATTYGRGLWETDLPSIQYKPLLLKGKNILTTESDAEAIYWTSDVELHKKASLYVNCKLHMPKGKSIILHKSNQLELGPNGRIVNECGENWGGIKVK